MKKIKQYIRVFFIGMAVFVVSIPILLFFSLKIKPVYTFINSKITYILQENFNATVSIEKISYKMPFDLIIHKFYMGDYQSDTLFYADKVKIRPLYYNLKKNLIIIDRIEVTGFRTEYRIDSLGYSNLDYFIYNLPETTDANDVSTGSFTMKIRVINVFRSSFFYSTLENDSIPYGFDVDTIDIFRFGLKIKNLEYKDEGVKFDLNKFNAYEKNGFKIKGLSANVFVDENNAEISKMILRLNKTRLFIDDFQYRVDSITGLEHFYVNIKNQSFVNTADLGFFSKYFINYNEKIKIGADISGTLDNMMINTCSIRYKNNSKADFSGNIIGVSDPENMYFDFDIENLQTSRNEISAIKDPFTRKKILEIPEEIQIPQQISYSGKANGYVEDIKVLGNIVSSSGNASFDLNILSDTNFVQLIGNLSVDEFDLGYILKNKILGSISLKDTLDITIKSDDKFFGFNDTEISQFVFNKYEYKNAKLRADFTTEKIIAHVDVADKNFKVNINLSAIMKNDYIDAKYSINIDTARLFPLNFVEDDELASFSFGLKGGVSGKDISDFVVNLTLSEPLILIKNLQKLQINTFSIVSENLARLNDNSYRLITVKSDFLNGTITGTIEPESFTNFISNFTTYYFPALASDTIVDIFDEGNKIGNNLNIDLVISNLKPILNIFAPTISLANNSKIFGIYSDANDVVNLTFSTDSITLSDNKINKLNVNFDATVDDFDLKIKADSIGLSEINFQNFVLSSTAKNDIGQIDLSWNNNSEKKNYGHISSLMSVSSDSSGKWDISVNIPKDTVFINDVLWTIKSDRIQIDTNRIDIRNLTFSTSFMGQNIGIKGVISSNPKDSLYLQISKFDISQLNPIIDNLKLNGFLKTQAIASNLLGEPEIFLSNIIEHFTVNDVRLGFVEQDLELNSLSGLIKTNLSLQKYGKTQKIVNGESKFSDTLYRSLNLLATYSLKDENYEAKLVIDNFKLKAFTPYFKEYIAFSRNTNINGNLYIKGDKVFYDVQGFMNLYGSFLLHSTGVNYTIVGGMRLSLLHNLIKLEKTVIVGPNMVGDATLWGTIKHKQFKDPYIDFNFKADTIKMLDLPRTSTGDYYGKAVASGKVELKGYLQDLSIIADITMEPETNITMLLDRPGQISNKTNILTFINPNDTTFIDDIIDEEDENLNVNIDLDLNLSLNPEAHFKIVFDEMTGEAFDIQGEGDIKVKKTALGDVVLFGKIVIVEGSYKFILENIINRRFVIDKGSSITFNGAPTDGLVDIATIYTIKNVNLFNLLQDNNYSEQKTQADCYIYLKGPILQPVVKFDIVLPKADRKIAVQVGNLDDANKNKQFLSLLLIGRFQPLPGLAFNPDANLLSETFNPGELISNQLNSFLTNLGTDVDLDVNYKTGDNSTTDQFDVELSVPLLNERVSINTDVGVGGTQNTSDQNSFIGDFEVDVKLNKKGNLKLKAYNKSNRNYFYQQGYTQGIGIQYKSDLDNLFKRDTNKVKQDTNKIKNKN